MGDELRTCPYPDNRKYRCVVQVWHFLNKWGQASIQEIASQIGRAPETVRGSIRAARNTGKRGTWAFRIVDWERNDINSVSGHGQPTPIWAIGDGNPDAPKPRARTGAQRNRASYARHRTILLARDAARRVSKGVELRQPVWLRGLFEATKENRA